MPLYPLSMNSIISAFRASGIRYVIPDSQSAAVEWNSANNKSFSNILKKFNVTVTKSDCEVGTAQGDASLAGAAYGIYKGDQLVDTYYTDENGQFTTGYYVCGDDWTIREISPSEGYLLDGTVYPVGAEAANYTVELNAAPAVAVAEQVQKGKPKYLPADEYLSGNVREKLRWAKRSAELYPEDYGENVRALEAVQPVDLTASEISVRLGATWLPPETIEEFMFELFSTPRYCQWNIHVHYAQYTGEWNVEGKSYDRTNVKAYNTYGTNRINGYKIGQYRGFDMELSFDTFSREYKITLIHQLRHTVTLGSDIFGNIQRLDNTFGAFEERMAACVEQLENTRVQLENAKAEVQKPFPQEEELAAKTARLNELNALLNLDKKENEIVDGERGEEEPSRSSDDRER